MPRKKTSVDKHMDAPEIAAMLKKRGYKNWQAYIVDQMAQGASKQEIKAELRVSNTLHTRLMEEEGEYAELIKLGEQYSEGWWMRQGRENLMTKSFNAVLWYMNMKNRHGWRDSVDHTSKGDKIPTPYVYLPQDMPRNVVKEGETDGQV